MPAKVILLFPAPPTERRYVFDERTTAILGKVGDCMVRFPMDQDHHAISRHHCLLDINPPDVRIRDLGSRNGTFVNGKLIGKRDKGSTPADARGITFPEVVLADGDEVRIGKTTFRVGVASPITCADCGVEVAGTPTADRLCDDCRSIPQLATTVTELHRGCLRCGKDVSDEAGQQRAGEFVCAQCRADPEQLVQRLLEMASTGNRDLVAIEGYHVERELGRGGMGAVYLASHAGTGDRVALKVMLPQVASNRRTRELFLREAHNTRLLRHPNVVRLHDLGCSQGVFFFTLEYCDGGSLADLLARRGAPLPADEAVRLIAQALHGLEYAHAVEVADVPLADGSKAAARGLVHRDIKPQNLLLAKVDGEYVAKVGDYGLSKAFDLAGLSGMSVTGSVAGTPVFMPRQQVAQYRYAKPEVDVWAMAASLYFALTLQYPRQFTRGKDPFQVVLQTDAIPIRDREPAIPKRLAAVIDKALVDRPSIGIASAKELREELQRVSQHLK